MNTIRRIRRALAGRLAPHMELEAALARRYAEEVEAAGSEILDLRAGLRRAQHEEDAALWRQRYRVARDRLNTLIAEVEGVLRGEDCRHPTAREVRETLEQLVCERDDARALLTDVRAVAEERAARIAALEAEIQRLRVPRSPAELDQRAAEHEIRTLRAAAKTAAREHEEALAQRDIRILDLEAEIGRLGVDLREARVDLDAIHALASRIPDTDAQDHETAVSVAVLAVERMEEALRERDEAHQEIAALRVICADRESALAGMRADLAEARRERDAGCRDMMRRVLRAMVLMGAQHGTGIPDGEIGDAYGAACNALHLNPDAPALA